MGHLQQEKAFLYKKMTRISYNVVNIFMSLTIVQVGENLKLLPGYLKLLLVLDGSANHLSWEFP